MNTSIKYKRKLLLIFSFLTGAFLIVSCGTDTITGGDTVDTIALTGSGQGIPTDQINWIGWNAEAMEQFNTLARKGHQTKHIRAERGGHVGGHKTFDNKVDIPANALLEDTDITVDVVCVEDNQQCGAGVDFLPSMNFESDVQITLSYKYLNQNHDEDHHDDDEDGDEDDDNDDEDDGDGSNFNFSLFFSQDGGNLWYPLEGNYEIDYDKQTISFWVDHFTRFAWGLDGNNDGDGGY
ncbi:MAG: hypothetical protein GXO91_07950 [FCB group bacterium]|nr:hypothetical protein [FCB group bacterium]